jgi:putative flavoprotein involved in K+ transport
VKDRQDIDFLVIGGGQAGLSLSYYLSLAGLNHLVLEKDVPFSAWRNRWEGFRTNTPNWMNVLPMAPRPDWLEMDGFATREEVVSYLMSSIEPFRLPIRTGVEASKVIEIGGGLWDVETAKTLYRTRGVAICIGAMSAPRLPLAAAEVPRTVPQLHSSEYRAPDQIGTRSVLIVGSASSGMQICRRLLESNRFDQIHLAASSVTVLPTRILGLPTHRFLHQFRLFDVRRNSVIGRLMYARLKGRADPIVPPTPRDLARTGRVHLHRRLIGASGSGLRFADGQTLALQDLTIIWCTGFKADYSFVELLHRERVFDAAGQPVHFRGVVPGAPSLYFVGLRYQHTIASHDIYGVGKDARHVALQVQKVLSLQTEHVEASAW